MLFWIATAGLTLIACLSVLLPFARQAGPLADARAHDLAIYKDQLSEVEKDLARGLIGKAEAEQARTEIARRILKSQSSDLDRIGLPAGAARWVALLAVMSVPLVSWGVYAAIGSPDLPSAPLQTRLEQSPAESPVEELVARAEAHLKTNPADGNGWAVLAPIYLRSGRIDDAVTAYQKAVELLGPNAERESGLGEALVAKSSGKISQDAAEAFQRALKQSPGDARARFYLALRDAQKGNVEGAKAAWLRLKNDFPPESPWHVAAGEAVERLANGAPDGPTESDVDNAMSMTPDERKAMIEGMVASLDARLRAEPKNSEGWERLIRAYLVLNKPEEARDALLRGVEAFGVSSSEAGRLEAYAVSIGLPKAGLQ